MVPPSASDPEDYNAPINTDLGPTVLKRIAAVASLALASTVGVTSPASADINYFPDRNNDVLYVDQNDPECNETADQPCFGDFLMDIKLMKVTYTSTVVGVKLKFDNLDQTNWNAVEINFNVDGDRANEYSAYLTNRFYTPQYGANQGGVADNRRPNDPIWTLKPVVRYGTDNTITIGFPPRVIRNPRAIQVSAGVVWYDNSSGKEAVLQDSINPTARTWRSPRLP